MNDAALVELLTSRQLLAADIAARARRQARADGASVEEVLIRDGHVQRGVLRRALENHYFCPAVDLETPSIDRSLLELLPRRLAGRHQALPIAREGDAIQVAFAEPDNAKTVEAVAFAMRRQIRKAVALQHELRRAIEVAYDQLEPGAAPSSTRAPLEPARAASAGAARTSAGPQIAVTDRQPVAIVEQVLREAIKQRASDVHVQPGEDELLVRFRLDGILHTVLRLPPELTAQVTSRLKVLGQMDVAERRRPQDGRFATRDATTVYDLRLSALPSQFGEKIVARVLTKTAQLLDLDNLRMPPAVRRAYQEVTDSPQGLFLVTGPTGSGKTTTLYATLSAIDRASVNVVTLEDPIEYSLPLITQVQVNEDAGLTFAAGLRSILRQDPDVILVGEIRDAETVDIACRAALTGHKVLSTIHTNDTSQAVTRLLNMGTPPYLVTATLRGVLSQRLIRVVCEACKEAYTPEQSDRGLLGGRPVDTLWRGAGCAECGQTGYRGRMAVYEYLHVDDAIRQLILERGSALAMREAARRAGMTTLGDAAAEAALAGLTTVAEVQRAVLSDEAREQVCGRCQRVVSLDHAICPFCQRVLKERCAGCGSAVEPGWQACPACGQEIDRSWQRQHCPRCEAPVDASWEQCLYCGTPLSPIAVGHER